MIMNCSEIKYRIKTASCESIVEHLNKCTDDFNPPLYTYIEIEKYGKKIFDNAVTLEAWDKDILVGLIAAYYNDAVTKVGYITNVSVIKSYQGLGISSKLLMHTIDYGRLNNFNEVRLEVNIHNSRALKLYKKYGFVKIKRIESTEIMNYLIPLSKNE